MSIIRRLHKAFRAFSQPSPGGARKVPSVPRAVQNFGNELFSWLGYARHGASMESLPLDSWFAFPASPRDDCDKNQLVLRTRSRDLYMSSSFFGSMIFFGSIGAV